MRELLGIRACQILVASILCGIARPVLADGSPETAAANAGAWYLTLALLAFGLLAGLVVAVLLIRAIGQAMWRADKAPDPEVPAARVVQDRDQAP